MAVETLMVNKDRIRQKLPELLIDGPVSIPENFLDYKRTDYRLRRMERQNFLIVDMRVKRIIDELQRLKESIDATF